MGNETTMTMDLPVNRTYKSTVFTMLYADRGNLLDLYNAMTGKHYDDPELLEINTLENAIYMTIKNDVSFLIDGRLSLYEHQSTKNPNLPLRFLLYISHLYSRMTKDANLYGTAKVQIPAPEFVVFYPNTTREVFLGRCGRLRSILQRRYPKQVRIGRAWADGVFTGQRLTLEAKKAMRVEHAELTAEIPPLAAEAENPSTVDEAMHDGRFTVYFQPQFDIRTGALSGAEALVRGIDEDGTLIPPAQFIEYLEESGVIRVLDLFVLEQSLAQAEQWRAAGLGTVPVAVNLSRMTLVHPSTLASVLAIQSRYPLLPPGMLEVEVTESAGSVDSRSLAEVMEQFRAYGIRFSLDDFGSQYANLSIFTNVKFDSVKLDRSLIADLTSNVRCQMLIRDLVSICHTCGMICVAEGVENRSQIDALSNAGCAYGQGYFFDRPIPAEVFQKKYLHQIPAK